VAYLLYDALSSECSPNQCSYQQSDRLPLTKRMLGTFPSKHSRVNLPDLLSRSDSDEALKRRANEAKQIEQERSITAYEQSTYFAVCFLYALGPSLLDIFLSRMCKQVVKDMLRTSGYSEEGHLFAYLYALTVSSYALAKCGSAPFMGYISDQLGRRKTLTTTLLATGVMLLLTGRCQSWSALILCRFVTGLFANGGLLTAYAADLASSLKDRTTLFSYFITAWAFARVAAAYIFPLVGEDVGICCVCAFACEVLAALLTSYSPSGIGLAALPEGNPEGKAKGPKVQASSILRNPLSIFRDRPSFRAAFREMLRDRLVALLFVTSLLMPRIDIAAYLWQKFRQGPSAVGYIKAVESVTVILIPLTPLIRLATGRFGHAGCAVVCAASMSVCWCLLVQVGSMNELYTMVLLRSSISTIYEPSIKSILMDSTRTRKREQIGSLAGLQQTMKGASQVMGSFWGSFLASQDWSAYTPLYISSLWCGANAVIIYVICCVGDRPSLPPSPRDSPLVPPLVSKSRKETEKSIKVE